MAPTEPPTHEDHLRWVADNFRRVLGSDEPPFEVAVAYLNGFNAATGYSLLRDFHDWLVVELGEGYEYHWIALAKRVVLDITSRSEAGTSVDPGSQAGSALFGLVVRHLDSIAADGGRVLHRAYEDLRRADGLP
jgi:hypothetical protein